MGVFYQEDPPNPSRKCFLAGALKDVLCNCHNFSKPQPNSNAEDDYPTSDFDDEEEEIVSEIRSRAMEKLRRKTNLSDSFSWVFSPATKELYITSMEIEKIDEPGNEDNTGDEFYSVQSFLTCSSAATKEAFFSVEANFSRCSSLNGLNFLDEDLKRRTILQELFHCEGWPFGLCRKAVLLPPLPKSPSESWLWSKGTKIVKI
ncbi:uncharacterized protein LOC111805793 [Cucurbita pepo subsp. pepo]|uniref:uncharacterized protein LOC111805793 n=1 Tax=Cucurbita pepo subsp. pepo TaxID=3664 RepID=UPI000C9D8B5D|nr:uncharacterized protein LOC111805793 [Cucurbita pepo subsp. pepo]